MSKCKGSGTRQRLAWAPSDKPSVELNGKPYPGAAVCIECSGGVLVLKKSVTREPDGWYAGTLRVHKKAGK